MLTIEKIKKEVSPKGVNIGDFFEYNDTVYLLVDSSNFVLLIDVEKGEWDYRDTSIEGLLKSLNGELKPLDVHMKVSYR